MLVENENDVQFHPHEGRKSKKMKSKSMMGGMPYLISNFSVASLCFGMPKTTCFPLPMGAERENPVGLN